MTRSELVLYIKGIEPECEAKEGKQFAEVSISQGKFHNLAALLRDNEETSFDFLLNVTGVDYGQDLGVIYHLHSTRHSHTLVLKIRTSDRVNPEFDTVTDLWKTAELHEREVYDLLGIKFRGHPDLRRLFLDPTWGFPLRKDYVDDVNIVTK